MANGGTRPCARRSDDGKSGCSSIRARGAADSQNRPESAADGASSGRTQTVGEWTVTCELREPGDAIATVTRDELIELLGQMLVADVACDERLTRGMDGSPGGIGRDE